MLGLADTSLISQFVDFISEKDAKKAVNFLAETFEKGYDPQEFAKALISYLRQAMLLKINPDAMNPVIIGLTKEEQEKIQNQVAKFTLPGLQKILNLFMEAENRMKYSSIPQLPLELAIVDITLQEG